MAKEKRDQQNEEWGEEESEMRVETGVKHIFGM
jgi:hypothetical protein